MTLYPESVAFITDLAPQGQIPNDLSHDEAGRVFTMGWCGIYAAALLEHNPTWTIVTVGAWKCFEDDEDGCSIMGDGVCCCMCDHIYAVDTEGLYHDVYGVHDPSALTGVTHHRIGDAAFRVLLESWYFGEGHNDADFAAWARELIATHHPANV